MGVISSLAGTDPLLAEKLASLNLEALLAPIAVLSEYAHNLGWEHADDDDSARDLGKQSMLNGAAFVHSAAVALSGNAKEISRRVWRGQVREVLPYLELHRSSLIELARGYLPKPPIDDGHEAIIDVYDLELRTLWYYLQRSRAPRQLIDRAGDLRRMRNALAHLEPLSAADLHRLARMPIT